MQYNIFTEKKMTKKTLSSQQKQKKHLTKVECPFITATQQARTREFQKASEKLTVNAVFTDWKSPS